MQQKLFVKRVALFLNCCPVSFVAGRFGHDDHYCHSACDMIVIFCRKILINSEEKEMKQVIFLDICI